MDFLGTTNTIGGPSEPLTLATIQRMMAKAPKRETWLSTRLFPAGNAAFRIKGAEDNFLVAHPDFWLRVKRAADQNGANLKPQNVVDCPPLLFNGIPIIEIDAHPSDTEARRQYIAAIWDRLRAAIEVASITLPDWLKTPPKFSRHG